ncbi:radical SAM protein [Tropicibacter sp. S64]|uniref:radical SAM protein n=1 Tax=Tropicibacter sp. S64 TaxID=3415122 RepID=UPI003C7DADA3
MPNSVAASDAEGSHLGKPNLAAPFLPQAVPITQVVLKATSACNLNCSYCYVYNKGDETWKTQPGLIEDTVLDQLLERIRSHALQSGQGEIRFTIHGGEPMLVGPTRFRDWCRKIHKALGHLEIFIDIQTNATLITEAWTDLFVEYGIEVNVSTDGPRAVHDRYRVDHLGRGSYDRFVRGIDRLNDAGIPFGILSVLQLGEDPVAIHRHFVDLGCSAIGYLLPAETHDTVAELRRQYGPTPCADYLVPVFDEWWFNNPMTVAVREFWNIARLILGGKTLLDSLGNPPIRFVGIQPDGAMESLDKLRVCEPSFADIGLNIKTHDLKDILATTGVHRDVMAGMPLPDGCKGCREEKTCAGGYLPNRYAAATGFNNPSVWCADLYKLFGHVRMRMEVTPDQTHDLRTRYAVRNDDQTQLEGALQ